MDNILQELKNYFLNKPVSKDNIKDNMKHKNKVQCLLRLFKNNLSGFAWDPPTNM